MRTPRVPAGSSRSNSPSRPNSKRSTRGSRGEALSLLIGIELRRSSVRSDLVPHTNFPEYELSDHTAKRRKLSELQGQHPMVLVLSRGGFCPKAHKESLAAISVI